ncbi:hypothetical protein DFAR_2330024 [Desulfarculales bacterium]
MPQGGQALRLRSGGAAFGKAVTRTEAPGPKDWAPTAVARRAGRRPGGGLRRLPLSNPGGRIQPSRRVRRPHSDMAQSLNPASLEPLCWRPWPAEARTPT